MKQTLALCALVLGFLAVDARAAFAELNTYMFVPGIPGSSNDAQHKEWVDVISLRQTWAPTDSKKSARCEIEVVKRTSTSRVRNAGAQP